MFYKHFLNTAKGCALALIAGGAVAATSGEEYTQYYDLLNEYCVVCHNFIDQTPSSRPLYLDDMYLEDLERDLVSWERVVRRLTVGQMPPQDQPHPNPDELDGFREWLVDSLDTLGEQRNDPGEFVFHRMNRTEYANTIRDIFGVELDITQYLPPDSSDAGFDNVATALTLTPGLMDRYLATAVQVSTMVVGDPDSEEAEVEFMVRKDLNQNYHINGLPLGTRGGTLVHYNFPTDGVYRLSSELLRTVDNADAGLTGQLAPHTYQILVDGEVVHESQVGGPEDHTTSSLISIAAARDSARARMATEVFIAAGPHDIAFTFVERPDRTQDILAPSLRVTQDIHVASPFPALNLATITGPMQANGVSDNPVRNRLFICRPDATLSEDACAEQILSRVARLAFSRPAAEREIDSIMTFFHEGQESDGFDAGIRAALPRILTSIPFLFRAEYDPENMAPGTTHPVSDLELASRLSFFLWSSIPDDELLTLAEQERLREPGVLEQQVARMLTDDRAKALTTNFPDQWLALRNMENVVPDMLMFPYWDHTLRQSAQEETRLFFDSMIRENRSVLDLLRADYTFMNERLAIHYGVPGIYGTAMRKVTIEDPNRFGLLGQASILSLTSVATRTSPVLRGKWVLANLIGTPPLTPPDDVDTTLAQEPGTAPKSVRQRLEQHREDPVCNSCHRNLDPIGFALENFDPIGRWRDIDETSGSPVDSAGMLADGTDVSSPYDLSQALLSRPDAFVGLVTEKLMTYALGRAIDAYDMPVVRDVVREAAEDDYRFMPLILAIVESPAFQLRQKPLDSGEFMAQSNTLGE